MSVALPPEWTLIFLLLGIGSGGVAAITALPIWFLFEERLGWRAR